jgi:hypothetical protein
VNIGEEAVFVESAKDIRHEYRKNGGESPTPETHEQNPNH